MARTEEDKVFRGPITVTLGGEEYEIKPLVIRDAREWRQRFAKLVGQLPSYANVSTDDAQGFGSAVTALLVSTPDQMADLFFSYAKEIDREQIEAVATEEELAKGIEQIMGVAFPLVRSLTGALGKMAQ